MKYMFLVHLHEPKYGALSEHDLQALDDQAIEYVERLQERGQIVAGNALEMAHTATTVRVRDGKAWVTDGPYAETNEQVGGFLVVEARDLSEAIQLATTWPCAYEGGVEIRPLRELVSSTNPEKRI
jgi:hypothetical protein